jgi:hypothetical protein
MNGTQNEPTRYVAYPKAAKVLMDRLHATPDEIAAWIWMCTGQDADIQGLRAFTNANELDPPPRFRFAGHIGPDYRAALMMCWFREADLASYEPTFRFITGKSLIDRWGRHSGMHAQGFIEAKIRESRLTGIHPTLDASIDDNSDPEYVPIESRLFVLADVEQIEAEDFGAATASEVSSCEERSATGAHGVLKSTEPSDIGDRETNQGAGAISQVSTTTAPNVESHPPDVGTPAWRTQNAIRAANARHGQAGGSWARRDQLHAAWASGKYKSRQQCAKALAPTLHMSVDTARKLLQNTPEPSRCLALT